jgi:hypothetical protein
LQWLGGAFILLGLVAAELPLAREPASDDAGVRDP